ncbi:MAG: aminotransferase class I/II-fold pyridoxal phosphate-dependent enzyme [Bacteroidales bacterium]|nr:aminotransferase class I/II-fold pyridoxal phosphate-dependent enzyme [Bacteroidales bacterium]
MHFKDTITSKLPNTPTSIFATMSKMANDHQAVNLSQGFPDFAISEELIERVGFYMKKGYNQYAPMTGVPELAKVISNKVKNLYGAFYDPAKEINITAGATQALFTAIAAFVRDEDEVIVFEPGYDAYAPEVRVNRGTVKYARMEMPAYRINWEQTARMISSRTRMIIINSPHNPTGSILHDDDLKQLEKLTRNTDIVVLSDEVYEHLIYDGNQHQSVCRFPELARRSFAIGSFGKTFHATGWKIGYALAPENLMAEFRKVHQWVVFAVNTPIQMAMADYLNNPSTYLSLPKFYQQKRDLFLKLIKPSRFKVIPSSGTYFQCLDYSEISQASDLDFAEELTVKYKIASIPLSPFYKNGQDDKILRFCFAKKEETLEKAAGILCKI